MAWVALDNNPTHAAHTTATSGSRDQPVSNKYGHKSGLLQKLHLQFIYTLIGDNIERKKRETEIERKRDSRERERDTEREREIETDRHHNQRLPLSHHV